MDVALPILTTGVGDVTTVLSDTTHGEDALRLDENVAKALPDTLKIIQVAYRGKSAWARTYRVTAQNSCGDNFYYFLKVSSGYHGSEALKGEFASTLAIHQAVPSFCPRPIASGTLKSDQNLHFYICKFYNFVSGLPSPISFCKSLALLHKTESPNGEFGFHCTTYNGNLPQDNTWCNSWELFFTNGLRHVLKLREERGGYNAGLDALLPHLFDVVIPRLLRPLESHGRKLKPSLVHGDLWYGNAGVIDEASGEAITFDPASFWAHNEYELGNWRAKRNMFTSEYFEAYLSHIPVSEPAEDFDDRNALYALRFNLHAATLFPDNPSFMEMVIEGIQRLNAKFPDAGGDR